MDKERLAKEKEELFLTPRLNKRKIDEDKEE